MEVESDLQKLLASMEPKLQPETYVFTTLSTAENNELQIEPLGWFREPEGFTLILEESSALTLGLAYAFPCRMITLQVHSSLSAVGFLAAITAKLAAAGISVNAISAYHHDHLFVPLERAEQALEILRKMMEQAG